MPKYQCPLCGLVVLDTLAPVELYDQAPSPYPAEPKIFCGRDGTVLLWGKGAILSTPSGVLVDGLMDPHPLRKVSSEEHVAAAERRKGSKHVALDEVAGGVSRTVHPGVPLVADLTKPAKPKDKDKPS